MPPNRTYYDYIDARELAIIELDTFPKDETHPFADLPSPVGRPGDATALRIREEYIQARSQEMTPRKKAPQNETALQKIQRSKRERYVKEAYRAKTAADHAKSPRLTQELQAQEDGLLKIAEAI